VWEANHLEPLLKYGFQPLEVVDSYHQIQIQADEWFRIRIDRLAANHAILYLLLVQQLNQRFEQIRVVHRYGVPKFECLHGLL
jgi:hypothetical protein